MRDVTVRKYRAIQKAFKKYYEEDRMRIDDCFKIIMQEYFIISQPTLERILRTDLPPEVEQENTQPNVADH
jgi:hypothetical protein